MKIEDNIRILRQSKGWTQEELAKKLGYTKQNIQRYESGKINIPYRTIIRLAELLDTTPEQLMGWDIDEHRINATSPEVIQAIFGTTDGVTKDMINEVLSFAKFLYLKGH